MPQIVSGLRPNTGFGTRFSRPLVTVALVLACLSFVIAAQAGEPAWTATALCEGMSVGHAINESGLVAGAVGSGLSEQAVVCDSEGVLSYLPTPEEATASRAVAINDLGQVAGLIQVDGFQEAAVWDSDGSITRLGFLPGGMSFSSARDINNNGEVVGVAGLEGQNRGFYWNGAGPIQVLPLPSGLTGSFAIAINDDGEIVGSARALFQPDSAVLWQDGTPVVLTPLAAGAAAAAEDINELDQIVGSSTTTGPPFGPRHPVLWDNGNPVDLGSFGGAFANATGVNEVGLVVGLMSDALNQIHTFVWDAGLATPLAPLPGESGSAAQDVNDAGRIVGASFTGPTSRATLWQQGVDTTAPALTVVVSPDLLWPPNHSYVSIQASVTATDDLDPAPTIALVSVTSSEPDNGPGDGNTTDDVVVDGPYSLRLRAERSEGGTGRTYTITYRASDVSGNSTTQAVTVMVPITR